MIVPSPLFQHARDEEILALVLEQTGPVTIPLDRLAAHDLHALELVATEPVDADATGITVSIRRRETLAERLTGLLEESYDSESTTFAEDAIRILAALGADPDHLAPGRPTP